MLFIFEQRLGSLPCTYRPDDALTAPLGALAMAALFWAGTSIRTGVWKPEPTRRVVIGGVFVAGLLWVEAAVFGDCLFAVHRLHTLAFNASVFTLFSFLLAWGIHSWRLARRAERSARLARGEMVLTRDLHQIENPKRSFLGFLLRYEGLKYTIALLVFLLVLALKWLHVF